MPCDTLDFYACRMFSARQEKGEIVAFWGSHIDEMQTIKGSS